MSGWIILATLSAAAVVAIVGAWWGGREWRRGGTHTLEDGNG